ncbi:MAG: hypothetical protein AAGE89_09320 [Pseudomonadota bacterium]
MIGLNKTFFRAAQAAALAVGLSAVPALSADLDVPLADAPADDRFSIFGIPIGGATFPERYVPSVTNPLFNESPFITSELRAIYFYHDVPDTFAAGLSGGGNVNVVALQARLKITDNLALIATKDGYVWADFNGLPDENGFVNIAGGLKYAVYQDKAAGDVLTVGLRYEGPVQELSTAGVEFQAAGAGFINPFITGVTELGGFQLQGSLNGNFAIDGDAETSLFVAAAHVNYELFENFYPLLEVNAYVPFNRGTRTGGALASIGGADVLNFGSTDRDTLVTVGGGFRYRFNDNLIVGMAGEGAVANREDSITNFRVSFDAVFNF